MCPLLSEGSRQYNQSRKIHPRDSISQLGYYVPSCPSSSSSSSLAGRESNNLFVKNYAALNDKRDCNLTDISDVMSDSSTIRSIINSSANNKAKSSSSFSSSSCKKDSEGTKRRKQSIIKHEKDIIDRYLFKQRTKQRKKTREEEFNSYYDDYDDDNDINNQRKQNKTDMSPEETSGFSENTQFESYLAKPDILLKDPNFNNIIIDTNDKRDYFDPFNNRYNNNQKLSDIPYYYGENVRFSPTTAALQQQQQPLNVVPIRKQSITFIGKPSSRMKRRNFHRNNRRMLTNFDGQHLVNPYALSELFSQSEIPGFREIFASDSYLRKFCWVVAFLFMTVLSLNDMTELITEYYDYPITVKVRHIDSSRLPFPAVTVCNLNVVRFSALCSTSKFDLSKQIPSELRERLCGIQVEKTKNVTDSDISDINNIGITTTTTTTTTTQQSTTIMDTSDQDLLTSVTTSFSDNNNNNELTTFNNENISATIIEQDSDQLTSPMTTIEANYPRPNKGLGNVQLAEHKLSSSAGSITTTTITAAAAPPPPSTTNQITTSATLSTSMTTLPPPTTLRRPPANGALDLGPDFVDPALVVMDNNRQSRRLSKHKRSIKLASSDSNGNRKSIARPFASNVRLPVEVIDRKIIEQRRASKLNQFGKLVANRNTFNNNNNAQQAIRGHGNQSPGQGQQQVFVNSFLNPFNQGGGGGGGSSYTTQSSQQTSPAGSHTQPGTGSGAAGGSASAKDPFGPTTFAPPALPDDFELTERQERELQENLTNWLAVMYNRDAQLTWSLGHQFDDMIMRCTMKSINCTHQRSFENSFTPTEGNCFTYRSKIKRRSSSSSSSSNNNNNNKINLLSAQQLPNSKISGAVFEEANLAGTTQGLELVLNLEKNEYISGSSQVGALVMIHHPSDLGYAASEATFVAPEFTTYIGLKMVNITRLPAPYPEYCVDNWPTKFADTLLRNSTYSQQACLKICLQKTIQSHCQCQSAQLPVVELEQQQPTTTTQAPTTSTNYSTISTNSAYSTNQTETNNNKQQQRIIICDTRRLATRHCVREVMFRAADRVHNCECPPKCQVVRYDKTISMARWPTREDKVSFDRGKMDVNFQNLAKVIVYFQTMTCEEVSQQAVFNAAKLFSALGGIMGMYVGFSFLSVFEIFEVMSRKMWHHFKVKLTYATSRFFNNLRNS